MNIFQNSGEESPVKRQLGYAGRITCDEIKTLLREIFNKEMYRTDLALNRIKLCASVMCPEHLANDISGF
jgi:hypothetical protein